MRPRNLFVGITYLLATLLHSTLATSVLQDRAELCSPAGPWILSILENLNCECAAAASQILALMASPHEGNANKTRDIMSELTSKVQLATNQTKALDLTTIDTYAKRADGLGQLSPSGFRREIETQHQACNFGLLSFLGLLVAHVDAASIHRRLFESGKEYVYGYSSSLLAGSNDYVSFASAVNITGELHIQGGSSVLNVQLNNVQLGLYNGEWAMENQKYLDRIQAINSTLHSKAS